MNYDYFNLLYFEQDGATPHKAIAVRVDEVFDSKVIGRLGAIEMSPIIDHQVSRQLISFFLGLVKDKVYPTKSTNN